MNAEEKELALIEKQQKEQAATIALFKWESPIDELYDFAKRHMTSEELKVQVLGKEFIQHQVKMIHKYCISKRMYIERPMSYRFN